MQPYELSFLKALAATISAEMLVGWILIKFFPKHFSFQSTGWRLYLFIAAASFMTLPYLWFIWPAFITERLWYLVISETWVCLMEAGFYTLAFHSSFKKALLFSFLLNGFSLGLGFLIKL